MRLGIWILLDEVNLASASALQRIHAILDGQCVLFEKTGDAEVVKAHPEFRLMANMNPPTDFGKKDLPSSIRSRFTEIYVEDVLDTPDLTEIVRNILSKATPHPPTDKLVAFYQHVKNADLLTVENRKPCYSLRYRIFRKLFWKK